MKKLPEELHGKLIDVQHEENIVLNYLHTQGIFQTRHITSPPKVIWFKNMHYVTLVELQGKVYYMYTGKTSPTDTAPKIEITFKQLKQHLKTQINA